MAALEKLQHRSNTTGSMVCVGLDADMSQLPESFKQCAFPQFEFNRWIIEQTHEYVAAYKPNLAFYEARGEQGWHELRLTMEYLQHTHPSIFTIADAKRADIGSTNQGYVGAIFDDLGFDAVTLHPYLGREALEPFLERQDKVSIILCKTSNPGAGELQNLVFQDKPLWLHVAESVSQTWNTHHNCMLVVGATYPEVLAQVRRRVGSLWLLVPGIGAQGGDLEAVLESGTDTEGSGLLINSSRAIIFTEDPRAEAQKLFDAIGDWKKNQHDT